MTSRVRGSVAAALAAALTATLLLAGCSTDDPDASGAASDAASPDPSGSSTASDPTETPTTPSVEPADGTKVEVGPISYRLVDDVEWVLGRQGQTAVSIDAEGGWYVSSGAGYPSEDGLDHLAEVALDTTDVSPPPERVDDREVAGMPCFVLERAEKDLLYYEVGGASGGESFSLRFEFPTDSPAARDRVEQILASVEWQ